MTEENESSNEENEINVDYEVKDEELLDDKIYTALNGLEDDIAEAYWEIRKFNPVKGRYNLVQKIPISRSFEDDEIDLKTVIKQERWGGAGTYRLDLIVDGKEYDRIPNIEFFIPTEQKEMIQQVKYDSTPRKLQKETSNSSVSSALNQALVEDIQTMRLRKNHKELKQMLNSDNENKSNNNENLNIFALFMQMNKEDQKRREEIEERRERAEERREQERKQAEKEREERERLYQMEQNKIALEREKMNQAMMLQLTKKEENPLMIALLDKIINEDKKDDPLKTILMDKLLKEDKKDPMIDTFPAMMKTLMDTQGQLFTSQIEMLKKNIAEKEKIENADEDIKKLRGINEYIISPLTQAIQPYLTAKLQGTPPSKIEQKEERVTVKPAIEVKPTPPPKPQEPEYSVEESVLVDAGKMLAAGKKAVDAWNFVKSKFNKQQMDYVFIENRQAVVDRTKMLTNAGYSEAEALINMIENYGKEENEDVIKSN